MERSGTRWKAARSSAHTMGQLGVIAIAFLSAAGFLGASLLAVGGNTIAAMLRPYAAPVAGGVLLAIAFSDVAP